MMLPGVLTEYILFIYTCLTKENSAPDLFLDRLHPATLLSCLSVAT